MLEEDRIMGIRERWLSNLEEECNNCTRCLTILMRDDEDDQEFEKRAFSHTGENRPYDYWTFADYLTDRYRRIAIILLCDDHFTLWIEAHEVHDDLIVDLRDGVTVP